MHRGSTLTFAGAKSHARRKFSMALSARNHLKGEITEVVLGTVTALVCLKVGDNIVEAVITRRSADALRLKKGDKVAAVVKATEVMMQKGSRSICPSKVFESPLSGYASMRWVGASNTSVAIPCGHAPAHGFASQLRQAAAFSESIAYSLRARRISP